MQLEKITMIDLEEYEGQLDWTANLYDTDVYAFLYNNKIVAEAVLFEGYDSIIVDNIETRVSRKHIGTFVLKKISDYAKSKNKHYITGESVPSAIEFWRVFNAEFNFNNNSDDLIPFKIKCSDIDIRFKKICKL